MEVALSDLVSSLLEKRGITGKDAVDAFLNPDYALHTHSPFLFDGMDRAVGRIFGAMAKGERIAIYADFDCDGIPGAAVLSDFFTKIGYTNFEVYIPHRDKEGYGFHRAAIDALAARGVRLIITVDVGTTAAESVEYALSKGVETIVTDHHEITGPLPDAVAVLNPKIAPPALSGVVGYPYPSLCGAGVAFKLVQALIVRGRQSGDPRFVAIPDGWEKWLLDLVAIATIADMVPLTGENRVLAYWGLQVLRKSSRKGLRALMRHVRIRIEDITEDDIGFSIAPRINAASRMDSPELALRLLTTRDSAEAEHLARELDRLNQSRKGVVGAIVREARKRAKDRFSADERVVVLGDTEWKPALLGLAANSLVGDRGGVACLWGRDAEGRIKGSCRSDGSLSVVELFAAAGEALAESGGHEMSGGFTVADGHVHTLHETFAAAAGSLADRTVSPAEGHDLLVTLSEIAPTLLKDMNMLAPFGIGNSKPVLCVERVQIAAARSFGKEKNHIELELVCAETGARARAYDFFRTSQQFSCVLAPRIPARVFATLERDTYRGGVALRLIDVLSS